MAGPVAFQNQFGDLYGSSMLPVLEELFRMEYERHPSRRSQVFKTVSHDREIYQSTELHDMDLFSQMAEGEEYSFKRIKQGADKTLTIVKWGLGFSISEEMVDDGKFDLIADMVRKTARSGGESQEISAMNIINNGYGSTTTADGQPLFDSAHTLPSGGTFRNRLSANADLDKSSLEQALIDFEQVFVGDSGIIYRLVPKILLVSPNLKRYAKELVGSELQPDSANNNLNSLRDDNLMVMSSPHLTDTDQWQLLTMPEDHGLRIVVRKAMETMAASEAVGWLTDSILYKSRYREVIGALHPYGVFGSPGA